MCKNNAYFFPLPVPSEVKIKDEPPPVVPGGKTIATTSVQSGSGVSGLQASTNSGGPGLPPGSIINPEAHNQGVGQPGAAAESASKTEAFMNVAKQKVSL